MASSFYLLTPAPVCYSDKINGFEKILWLVISANINNAGYCKLTNSELAKKLKKSSTSISTSISNLKTNKFLAITQETHNNIRRLYPKYPGNFDEKLPDKEELNGQIDKLQNAIERGIRLNDFEFKAFKNKLIFSPLLDDIEDNTEQFLLTPEKALFFGKFATTFPTKKLDIQLATIHSEIDYEKLFKEIMQSDFLMFNDNLSLRWIVEHSDEICFGKYRNYERYKKTSGFIGRNYTREELNALVDSVDEIEI